jgi:iron complex outermembrane receptor protein
LLNAPKPTNKFIETLQTMCTKLSSSQHKVTTVLRALAVAGVAGFFVLLPAAYAQVDTNAPTELKPVVVTGSFIPTAETVGAAPVDVITADSIQKVGSQDVLETLKKLNPVFAGNGNIGQTLNNGGGGEANVALRNLATLVLLDGRRLANSAFSSGSAVDLNTIPLAMIERIEVLKDGASAIYGSDAIGGVVNIITKKDFNGVEIGGRYGFATKQGDVTEQRAYIVGGTSTEKSSFVAGAQYYNMDPLLTKDRNVSSLGIADLLSKGLFPPTYVSPTFPGRVQSGGVSYILAGSPFAVGAPGYNPAITAPPVTLGKSYNSVPAYLEDHPGVYIPISSTPIGQALNAAYARLETTGEAAGWPLLNTTLLGTASIQSQDRRQVFANASHELFGKQMEVFGNFLYANTFSRGELAPSPLSSLGNGNVLIRADSPINPFQIDLGAGGAGSPRVRTRFIELGNRLYENQNDVYHIVGGFKGRFENDYTYEVAYNYNRNDQIQYSRDSVNGAALELATTPGDAPGLSQLRDAAGQVPLFNPFALPGGNSPRTMDMLRTAQIETGLSELWGADANITGTPFDLPAGKFAFAVGGGFYTESLQINYDGLTQLGKIPGGNQFFPMPLGRRDSWSGFIETRFPITSEEKNIPGFYSLELTAAGRLESFNPGGDSAVPKVGLRWQPVDNQLTLRGSYSQSFLAPNVFELFGAPAVSYDTVNAGGNGQVQMNWTSNPNLKPADAENWGAGVVFSPKFVKGLTVSLDYYHVKTKNDVFRVGAQAVADSLIANGVHSEFANSFFFDDGTTLAQNPTRPVTVANWGSAGRPLRNGATQETDGLDLRADYELPTDNCGKFTFYAAANVLFNYRYGDPLIGGPFQYAGQFTDNGPAGGAQGTLPSYMLNLGVSWDIKNFTYTVNARYLPEVDDLGDMHPSAGSPVNDYTLNGQKWVVPDYYAIDMRLAYEFGKGRAEKRWYDGTRIAVGVNNVTDTDPPLIASASEDNTDKSTYDLLGRFFYLEISKKF